MSRLNDILHDPRLDSYLKLKIYLYILDVSRTKEGCPNNVKAISRALETEYTKATRTINSLLKSGIITVSSDGKKLETRPAKCCPKGNIQSCPKGNTETGTKRQHVAQKATILLEERTKEDSYPYKLHSSKEVVVATRGVSGGNNHNDGNGATTIRIPPDSLTENGVTDEERKKMFELLTDAYPKNHIGSRAEAYFEFQLVPHLDTEFPIMMAQIEDLTSRPGKEWDEDDSHYVPFLKDYLDRRYWRTKYQNRTLYPSSSYSIESIRKSIESEKKADSDKTDISALASDLGL